MDKRKKGAPPIQGGFNPKILLNQNLKLKKIECYLKIFKEL